MDPNYSEDEEDKKAKQQDIPQHWQGVQKKHDQNSHTYPGNLGIKAILQLSLLGILFIARNGLRTRTVLIAERFSFSTSMKYSKALAIFFL